MNKTIGLLPTKIYNIFYLDGVVYFYIFIIICALLAAYLYGRQIKKARVDIQDKGLDTKEKE